MNFYDVLFEICYFVAKIIDKMIDLGSFTLKIIKNIFVVIFIIIIFSVVNKKYYDDESHYTGNLM